MSGCSSSASACSPVPPTRCCGRDPRYRCRHVWGADEHLQLSAKAFLASAGASPVPIQFIAVGASLFRVVIPNMPPTLQPKTIITNPLPHSSIRLDFEAEVPVGPRSSSHLQIEITPSLDGQQEHSVFDQIPPSPVTLADLQDRQDYTATAQLFDVAGNASKPWSSHFRYAMPFYQNPWIAAAIKSGR